MPPHLEKNHVVPTAWQDEALARDGVSREVPCSALKGETVADSLPATPKFTDTPGSLEVWASVAVALRLGSCGSRA